MYTTRPMCANSSLVISYNVGSVRIAIFRAAEEMDRNFRCLRRCSCCQLLSRATQDTEDILISSLRSQVTMVLRYLRVITHPILYYICLLCTPQHPRPKFPNHLGRVSLYSRTYLTDSPPSRFPREVPRLFLAPTRMPSRGPAYFPEPLRTF